MNFHQRLLPDNHEAVKVRAKIRERKTQCCPLLDRTQQRLYFPKKESRRVSIRMGTVSVASVVWVGRQRSCSI